MLTDSRYLGLVGSRLLPSMLVTASTLLGLLIGLRSEAVLGVLVVVSCMIYTVSATHNPMVILYGIVFVSATMSVFREISISIGTIRATLSGFSWLLFAAMLLIVALAEIRRRGVPRSRFIWVYAPFLGWVAVRLLSEPARLGGLKDVLWYSLPLLVNVGGRAILRQASPSQVRRLERMICYSVLAPAVLYVFTLSIGLAEMTWRGPQGELIGASRGIPLYLLVVLSLALSNWRYDARAAWAKPISILTVGTILFTGARMASVIALGLLTIKKIDPRHRLRLLVAIAILGAMVVLVISNIPILQRRFFFTDNWAISQGLRGVNTAGRNAMWPVTLSSAMERPILGWGLGSARRLVALEVFGGQKGAEYYPHNEYLQVLHDLGLPGVVFMLAAWLSLLARQWKLWETSTERSMLRSNMAGSLAIGVILISSLTDNTLHYPLVLGPAMILVDIAEYSTENASKLDAAVGQTE